MFLTLLFAAQLPTGINRVVEVEGRKYRVEVKGAVVRVFQKAIVTKPGFDRRARMRRAVEVATGCKIVDDYWHETSIEGSLDCSAR